MNMTLEQHFKNYTKNNPNSEITLFDWKDWFGNRLKINKKYMENTQTKIDFLKSKGWKNLTKQGNWVDTNKVYTIPDIKGITLEDAYNHVKNNEEKYRFAKPVLSKVIIKENGKEITGEVVQKVIQCTMDGIMFLQYVIKSEQGVHIRNENEFEIVLSEELNYN